MTIPIFVISLQRATDRRESIASQMHKADREFEFIDAVDGKTLDLDSIKHRLVNDMRYATGYYDLSPSEIGCFLSHYNLWCRMVDEKILFALILEDDATWDEDFFEVVDAVVSSKYYWNIVHLSAPGHEKIVSVVDTIGRHKLVRYKRDVANAIAYLIDLDGADKLRSFCYQIRDAIDRQWARCWQNGCYFYHVVPPMASQSGKTPSTIQHPSKKPKHQLKREMGHLTYWLKANQDRYARKFFHLTHPRRLRQ